VGNTRQAIRVRVRAFRGRARPRRAGVWIAAVALVAASCGLPHVPPKATTAPDPVAASATTAPSPRPAYPNEATFTSPIDRLIYRIAFDRCAVVGVQGAARDYGGNPSDVDSIANAYARSSDPDHVQPAFLGCRDGLGGGAP